MCDLVRKCEGGGMFVLSRGGVHWQGGPCFFFREGGSIGMGGGGVGKTKRTHKELSQNQMGVSTPTNFKNDS